MRSPEERGEVVPDIIAGRRVRRVDVQVVPHLDLFVLEAVDPDAVLDETLHSDGDPYAAILWPTALAAAARLAEVLRPGDVVLDVGAGTGLVALASARLGARTIALDHDPFARAVITEAARLQRLHVEVIDGDVASDTPLPAAGIVVMADLLYEQELARAAARRVIEAIARGSSVIVGDPGRFSRVAFERTLNDAHIDIVFDDVVIRVPGEPQPARVGVAFIAPRP